MTDWSGEPVFTHLIALSDERGVFEHARYAAPRQEHGYCVDDVSRALIVLTREPSRTPELTRLADVYLRFLESAVLADGRAHNRMSTSGRFTDRPGAGDWWGRAVWALGITGSDGHTEDLRRRGLNAFHRAAAVRTVDLRAIAFAGLGAAGVVRTHPHDDAALKVLRHVAARITAAEDDSWPWPERRLRYANAALPEALLAAGTSLHDSGLVERGLRLLRFLTDIETRDGHFSVTGTQQRGPGHRSPQFDQQPIEVAALADACARAFDITGDSIWREAVGMAWAWFTGDNDSRTPMYDPGTGAGYDGLTPTGRNDNRGAESTLAALSTYQQARSLGVHSRVPV